MGKSLKGFFSETGQPMERKLTSNIVWMVLYKVNVFLSQSEIQNGRHRRTWFNIQPYEKKV